MDTMKLGTKQGSEGQIRAQREGDFMDTSINQVQKFTKTLNPKPREISSGLYLRVRCCFCCFSIHPTFDPLGLWNKKISQSTTLFGCKVFSHLQAVGQPFFLLVKLRSKRRN
jgi:hypothetical protein